MTTTRSVYELARLADVSDPDTSDSPGGVFLRDIAESVAELDRELDPTAGELEDYVHELADSAVPVHTYAAWCAFVDLCAWQESDDDGLIAGAVAADDMSAGCNAALYMIAARLARALIAELDQ